MIAAPSSVIIAPFLLPLLFNTLQNPRPLQARTALLPTTSRRSSSPWSPNTSQPQSFVTHASKEHWGLHVLQALSVDSETLYSSCVGILV